MIHTQINRLIDNAPDALSTLCELTGALCIDANYAATIPKHLLIHKKLTDTIVQKQVRDLPTSMLQTLTLTHIQITGCQLN